MQINGDTKVGALLDAHPELEDVLVGLSPEFKRLQNPILRRTVAKVATLSQAARIGGIPTPDLVRALRRALGQEVMEPPPGHDAPQVANPEPEWARHATVAEWLDAEKILAGSGSPVGVLSPLPPSNFENPSVFSAHQDQITMDNEGVGHVDDREVAK